MKRVFLDGRVTIHVGDVREQLRALPADHFDCVVTSPPYWGLRDYGTGRWEGGDPACDHRSPTMRDGRNEDRALLGGSAASNRDQLLLARRSSCGKCGAVKIDDQIGLEPTLGEHLAVMVEVFREVRRVLKPSGVCWINYGDCYATAPNGRSAADTKALTEDDRTFRDKPFSTVGAIYDPDYRASTSKQRNREHGTAALGGRVVAGGYLKPKDLCMVPQRLFIALQDDGWWVRSVLPWVKRNGMPESISDRPANSLEYVAMLTKSDRYWYDPIAVRRQSSGNSNSRVAIDEASAGARVPGVSPKSARARSGIRANESWHEATAGAVTPDRNFRNTDLFFSSVDGTPLGLVTGEDGMPLALDVNPQGFSEAHFATFPPALVDPMIRASSSERGCCRRCGAPWGRITVDVDTGARQKMPDGMATYAGSHSAVHRDGREAGAGDNPVTAKVTIGWYPECDCDGLRALPAYPAKPGRAAAETERHYKAALRKWREACAGVDAERRELCAAARSLSTERARVLDPFGGSGTTAVVCAALGRLSTLIELNPEYATLAQARIESAFMGKDEGARHMVKRLGKIDSDAGPLFSAVG